MKAILLSTAALVAAAWSGNLTIGWIVTGAASYAWADMGLVLVSVLLQVLALNSVRAHQTRVMVRDLRSIEALLDDREFDHV